MMTRYLGLVVVLGTGISWVGWADGNVSSTRRTPSWMKMATDPSDPIHSPDPSDPVENPPAPVPIRQGAIKFQVIKFWYEREGDSYVPKEEVVCSRRTSIPVYDLRNYDFPFFLFNPFNGMDCETIVGLRPAKLNVGGYLSLNRITPLGESAPQDVKVFYAYAALFPATFSDPTFPWLTKDQHTFSYDLNLRSLEFSLSVGPAPILDQDPDFANNVYFGVRAELVDEAP